MLVCVDSLYRAFICSFSYICRVCIVPNAGFAIS